MIFECLPILSTMNELYQQPISQARFQTYLQLLQGQTKDDMLLPIAGYNPMAKPHVLEKVNQLQALEAEEVIKEILLEINKDLAPSTSQRTICVAINLADDLKGGWTNRYTTDFDNKFKINALINRNFCTPYFWSSEEYSTDLIRERTYAYAYRTLYWLNKPKPLTLADHLKQEIFAAQKRSKTSFTGQAEQFRSISQFYDTHQDDEDYSIIFNFFYGDAAAQSLGYPSYELGEVNGFEYAHFLAKS